MKELRRIKSFTAALFVVVVSLMAQMAFAEETSVGEPISLVVGQQKIMNLPDVTRIAIGNPNIANVKVTANKDIIVTAISEGQTEMSVWRGQKRSTYAISVSRIDMKKLVQEVSRLLGKREGLTVRMSGDRIYIDGQALTLDDIERAEEISDLYPQVRSLVKLDPSAHAMIAQQINKVLVSAGLDNAKATVVGSTVFLEGTVNNEGDLQKAEILVKSISKNVQSVLRIGPSKMVEAEVEFVELQLSTANKVGFDWPTSLSATANLGWSATTNTIGGLNTTDSKLTHGINSNFSFGLNLAFNDGVTRVLARPTLVAASGQQAKFLVGGEIPIVFTTDNQIQIEFKEYGVRLEFTPTIDVNSIQANILAEVSAVDQSVSVMNIPGFSTRRVETVVTVKDGETIVLGGLVQRREGKDVSKLGLLGHIPILGELFKSRGFSEGKTDMVVFITPRLIDPSSERVKKQITGMANRYRLSDKEVGFSIFD